VTGALLSLGAAAVAAIVTRWVAAGVIPRSVLLRSNYRGIPIPTGLGIAVLAGTAGAWAFVGFVHAVARAAPRPALAMIAFWPLLLLGFGFGLLGLFDDISAQPERGWRSHLPALARGKITPGTLKLAGGAMIAFAIASGGASSLGWALADGALIALMANLFNSLDVRPARAEKAFLVGAVPLAVLVPSIQTPLAAVLGATAAFVVIDLHERAMLGDAGSNALGAILGGAVLASDPEAWLRLALLGLLVALTLVAEGPTLSAWIDRIGPLRALDRAGRVPS
jgi:UDP-GlcNAc:undecaprenyl-phosphate/decaprenyl-phosphate GlcNAc-1-phosphate transferase